MPDSFNLSIVIGEALRSFRFSDYGYDELSLDLMDPTLDISNDLANHIVLAIETLLED